MIGIANEFQSACITLFTSKHLCDIIIAQIARAGFLILCSRPKTAWCRVCAIFLCDMQLPGSVDLFRLALCICVRCLYWALSWFKCVFSADLFDAVDSVCVRHICFRRQHSSGYISVITCRHICIYTLTAVQSIRVIIVRARNPNGKVSVMHTAVIMMMIIIIRGGSRICRTMASTELEPITGAGVRALQQGPAGVSGVKPPWS